MIRPYSFRIAERCAISALAASIVLGGAVFPVMRSQWLWAPGVILASPIVGLIYLLGVDIGIHSVVWLAIWGVSAFGSWYLILLGTLRGVKRIIYAIRRLTRSAHAEQRTCQ